MSPHRGFLPRYAPELALDARASRGEGPLWDPAADRLVWVDIDEGAVHTLDPGSGSDRASAVGQPVGAVALRARGGLVLAVRDGFALMQDGAPQLVTAVEADKPMNRMNDGKVDPHGRFWAGTMAIDMSRDAGALYRLDHDLRARTMLQSVSVSNGLDWSPDGRTMYFIDSLAAGVDAFDYDAETGSIARRRRVIDVPERCGLPDGMTVDADGNLWVAFWGVACVRSYHPSGKLMAVVDLPVSNVTSCTFGGPRLSELYITTARAGLSAAQLTKQPEAGGIFVCTPAASGRAPNLFTG